jgi:hypothetical protein
VSHAAEPLLRIPVSIEFLDGRREDLSVITPRALLKLTELVNREEPFIDVESLAGERFLVAKTAVKMIRNRVLAAA